VNIPGLGEMLGKQADPFIGVGFQVVANRLCHLTMRVFRVIMFTTISKLVADNAIVSPFGA
jgi:hypothetical protein